MTCLSQLLSIGQEAVDIASRIVTSQPVTKVHTKDDRDYYSDVDAKVEDIVREFLSKQTPSFGFVGEENTGNTNSTANETWVLDPLDGTSNFIHTIPLCGISLGLLVDDTPVLGVIDLPFLSERYWATQGCGAFNTAGAISVAGNKSLREAVVSIGDYAVGIDSEKKNHARFALTRLLVPEVERVRMFGSASVDLAWLSAGRTDASIALGNKPWDMTAGVAIARESGAHVIDFDGTNYTANSQVTIATSQSLAGELQRIVMQAIRLGATE